MSRGTLFALTLFATALAAQPSIETVPNGRPNIKSVHSSDPPKYVRFLFDGNPEEVLADFLKSKLWHDLFQKKLEGEWHKFLEKPPENLEEFVNKKLQENPLLRGLVEKFLNDNPELRKGNPLELGDAYQKFAKQLEENKNVAETILKGIENKVGPDGLPKIVDLVSPKTPPEFPKITLQNAEDFNEDLSLDERFAEWLKDVLNDETIQDHLTEFLRDSPDLREAIGDLLQSIKGATGDADWLPKLPGGEKWNFDLKPPKLPFELGQLPQLPNFKMPPMPKFNVRMPKLGNFGLPKMPGFGPPRVPSAPDVSAASDWLYPVAAVVGVGLAFWLMRKLTWRWRSMHAKEALAAVDLPASITTRSELRQAFDALALARFGAQALPWNHRLIAARLPADESSAAAVNAFANLYEMARYTPGDERLSEREQEDVRASLAVLTGGAG